MTDVPGGGVSLVLLAHNDEASLASTIRSADAALRELADAYEIIVVLDGGSDATAAAARSEAAANPRVRMAPTVDGSGYGAALRCGVHEARFDVVAVMDADGGQHPRDLADLLPLCRRGAAVWGLRDVRPGSPPARWFSRAYDGLVGCLLGVEAHDVNCGLKVFRRESLARLLPEADDRFANTEMLYRARKQGLPIKQVSVGGRAERPAGPSLRGGLRESARLLATLLPLWWTRELYPNARPPAAGGRPWYAAGLLFLAVISAIQLFSHLGYPLFEPDEGRYAEIAREMQSTGEWTVPTLFGEPYFDKPPLFYWLIAVSFQLVGTEDWVARLVPACAAWLSVMATYFFGCRVFGVRAAFLSSLVLVLSLGFVAAGRFLILDSLLSLWVCLALYAGYEAIRGPRLRWGWWLAAAACCGLGLMTKGPIALVLVAPPVLACSWLCRSRCGWRPWAVFLAVVAAVAAPWHVAIMIRQPGFAYEYFWIHHVERFVSGMNHAEPVWYYAPVLFLASCPWTLLLIPLARFQISRSPHVAWQRPAGMGFFVLSAGWCLLFFSLSRCKLPPYILPAFPSLAMLVGVYLERAIFQPGLRRCRGAALDRLPQRTLPVLAAAALVVVVAGWVLGVEEAWLTVLEATACGVMLGVALKCGGQLRAVPASVLCAAVAFFVSFEMNGEIIPVVAQSRAPLPAPGQVTRLLGDRHVGVAMYGRGWGSVPFYMHRDDVRQFDNTTRDELARFLDAHDSTLVLQKRGNNIDPVRRRLPPGMQIARIAQAGRVDYWLVQHRRQASLPGHRRQ